MPTKTRQQLLDQLGGPRYLKEASVQAIWPGATLEFLGHAENKDWWLYWGPSREWAFGLFFGRASIGSMQSQIGMTTLQRHMLRHLVQERGLHLATLSDDDSFFERPRKDAHAHLTLEDSCGTPPSS